MSVKIFPSAFSGLVKDLFQKNRRRKIKLIIGVIAISLAIAGFFWDSDGDRLWDWEEKIHGTDSLNKDTDGDSVRDGLEVKKYGTDPLKIDTDGGGVDDLNEIFTYGMDPNNPNDDLEFMEKIPQVKARAWSEEWLALWYDEVTGHLTLDKMREEENVQLNRFYEKHIIISMRDPLIRWYAERTEIRWETDSEEREVGKIYTDGEPIYLPPQEGFAPSLGVHGWNEVYIDGKVYIVNYNDVIPRDDFYARARWEIISIDYDPNWYKRIP